MGTTEMFIYGTQFYRPPHPPRGIRRKDLERIARECNFNTIKIWAMWNWCNPNQGEYVFDELEEIMEVCEEFELKVVVNIILENAPYWVENLYPDAGYVNAAGQQIRLRGQPNTISGGWPGLCLDHEGVREAAGEFLIELVKDLSKYKSLYLWDCWNEPHLEPCWIADLSATDRDRQFCYCENTKIKFLEWLKGKYKNISSLNDGWCRRYRDWNEISPPQTHGSYSDWLDWKRFLIDNITRQMRFRYETIKKVDPKHEIMSHSTVLPPLQPISEGVIDPWALGDIVDKWGVSEFPGWFKEDACLYAARLDVTRSSACGKDFWISELQGGTGMGKPGVLSGLRRGPCVRARDIRLWNWLGAAYGAKAIIYWGWRPESSGMESPGYGLLHRNGETTDRLETAVTNNRLLQKYNYIFKNYRPEPEVAVLYDCDNSSLCYVMDGKEDLATASYRGYYRALWEADLLVDFIKPGRLMTQSYSIIMVPFHFLTKMETVIELKEYVAKGGTVLIESCFGLYNEKGMVNDNVPPHGFEEVAGLREDEWFYTEPGNDPQIEEIYNAPSVKFLSPVEGNVQARTLIAPLLLTTAQPLAYYQDKVVAAYHKFGKGECYYFGTSLGSAICHGDRTAKKIVKIIVANKIHPPIKGDKLRPRLVASGDEALLVIINEHKQEQTDTFSISRKFTKARDIHNGRMVNIENTRVKVKVRAEDVTVLHLQ